MDTAKDMSRRSAMAAMAGVTGGFLAAAAPSAEAKSSGTLKGRVNHSVCRWCYQKTPLDELCKNAKAMGIQSVELLSEREWTTAIAHGLTCAMANGPTSIPRGWNRPQDHDRLVKRGEGILDAAKEAGLPNMIVFSGSRDGLSDSEGIKNCAKGLKRLMGHAEKVGITVCMELLNSKRNHPDYQCDHTEWGVNLVQEVASERFKLLYDIYHMQIMEGDVIATIQENIDHIAHFHTGGVPGRNEIDETQELFYRRICEAIVETGFRGFIAQEFIPKRDPMTSLAQGIEICDV